jgi:hypothetical protein
MENLDLYKNRSFTVCIRDGYALLITHLKNIFKKTWIPALALALIATVAITINMPDRTIHDIGMARPMTTFILLIAVAVLLLAAIVWHASVTVRIFNEKPLKTNLMRMALVILFCIVLDIVGTLITSGTGKLILKSMGGTKESLGSAIIVAIGATVIVGILLFVVFLPFVHSCLRYVVDTKTTLCQFFKRDYRCGWRHWGFLFIVLFLITLITSVLMMVIMVPFGIIFASQLSNQLGMLDGDASGVPTYFPYLFFLTTIITMFILSYVCLWIYFVMVYACTSIITQDKEREEQRQQNTTLNDLQDSSLQ